MTNLTYRDRQSLLRKIALIAECGACLARFGAETRLTLQSMSILGKALKLEELQCSLSAQGVTVTVPNENEQLRHFVKVTAYGINMSAVTACHQLCLKAEAQGFASLEELEDALSQIKPYLYPKLLLIIIEAAAAGLFAFLNGADLKIAISSTVGGVMLMSLRFFLLKRGFFDTFVFMSASFTGCLTALVMSQLLGLSESGRTLAIMATSLILVPGFPYMNGFLDIFKGYTACGLLRLAQAVILTVCAAIGILGVTIINTALN